jgi:hypothetical protein
MNKKLFQRCVSLSRDLAVFDSENTQKHLSFLCVRSKIFASGMNEKWKSDRLANRFNYRFNAVHSELKCLKPHLRFIDNFDKFTLVNVRINRNGEIMFAKPCNTCINMLDFFGVRNVFYSVNETDFGQL